MVRGMNKGKRWRKGDKREEGYGEREGKGREVSGREGRKGKGHKGENGPQT